MIQGFWVLAKLLNLWAINKICYNVYEQCLWIKLVCLSAYYFSGRVWHGFHSPILVISLLLGVVENLHFTWSSYCYYFSKGGHKYTGISDFYIFGVSTIIMSFDFIVIRECYVYVTSSTHANKTKCTHKIYVATVKGKNSELYMCSKHSAVMGKCANISNFNLSQIASASISETAILMSCSHTTMSRV